MRMSKPGGRAVGPAGAAVVLAGWKASARCGPGRVRALTDSRKDSERLA